MIHNRQPKASILRNLRSLLSMELREHNTSITIVEDFAVFFKDKVESVRASTASTPLYDCLLYTSPSPRD